MPASRRSSTGGMLVVLNSTIGGLPRGEMRVDRGAMMRVEVIDDRARILLLASAPHPDVATVRQILSQKQSMEVVVKNPESCNINLSNFDAVICFQLPSINGNDQIVQQIRQSQLPVWYIGGNQTAYSRLNALQGLISVRPAGKSLSNEITPIPNAQFPIPHSKFPIP
jgi:hypothetical protein